MKKFASLLLTLVIIATTTIITIFSVSASVELPRHVAEVVSNAELCRTLYKQSTIVAVIVSSLTDPSDSETALLEAFSKAAMVFTDKTDEIKFIALASESPSVGGGLSSQPQDNDDEENFNKDTVPASQQPQQAADGENDIPDDSSLVRSWITRSSTMHHKSGNVNGVFVFRRKFNKQADILWRDWHNETDDIDVPLDALPVDMDEILLAPSPDTTAERIARRVKCLQGAANVRELRTESDLNEFILNSCHPQGLSIVAWSRNALFPMAQRVPKTKLSVLRKTQEALATVAQLERSYLAFGWVDDDAPLLQNTTYLALANGNNAPLTAYVCDEESGCSTQSDPFDTDIENHEEGENYANIKVFPFRPFDVIKGVPESQLTEVMQIAVSEFVAELMEVVEQVPPTGAIEYGIHLNDFPITIDSDTLGRLEFKSRETQKQLQERFDREFEEESQNKNANSNAMIDKKEALPTPHDTLVHMAACREPVREGDKVRAMIIGDALSFDPVDSRPISVSFYRPRNIEKGDVLQIGDKNNTVLDAYYGKKYDEKPQRAQQKRRHRDLPPQFSTMSSEFFSDRFCYDPPTRANIIMRANRHYNVSDLPPNVLPHSTLKFYFEILGRVRSGDSSLSQQQQRNKFRIGGAPVSTRASTTDEETGDEGEDMPAEEDAEEEYMASLKQDNVNSGGDSGNLNQDDEEPPEDPNEILDPNNAKYNFKMTEEDIKEGRAADIPIPTSHKQKSDEKNDMKKK